MDILVPQDTINIIIKDPTIPDIIGITSNDLTIISVENTNTPDIVEVNESSSSILNIIDSSGIHGPPGKEGPIGTIPELEGGVGISLERLQKPPDHGIFSQIVPFYLRISSNCDGSWFYNYTNPSAEVEVKLLLDDIEFGTLIVYPEGSHTFISESILLVPGSKLSFEFPQQDSTWGGVIITLKGIRIL